MSTKAVQAEYDAVAQVVRKHTGHEATSVEAFSPNGAQWYQSYGDAKSADYSVRCEQLEYVVRVPNDALPWPMGYLGLTQEYHAVIGTYVLEGLRQAGLPAPAIYAVDRDCEILDRPVALTSRLPGRPWRYYEEVKRGRSEAWDELDIDPSVVGRQMGGFVKGLHGLKPIEGFGPLTDEGVGLMASWPEFIRTLFQGWARKAAHREAISESQLSAVSSVIDKWSEQCHLKQGYILHMSDIMSAALVDASTGAVTGVSQAAEAWSGDPDYELEWFAYYDQDAGGLQYSADEFARGYGRSYIDSSDKRLYYRMSIYLCKLTWLDATTTRGRHHQQHLQKTLDRLA